MLANFTLRRLTLIALAGCAAVAATWLASPSSAADAGVLVLRNGNVLSGKVQPHGDGYRVDLATAQLYVPGAQVELCCHSLTDAYEARRSNRVGQSADGHLQLARWCMRNDLLDQAAREVLDARTIDAGHPGLVPIDAQLGHLLRLRALHDSPQPRSESRSATEQTDGLPAELEASPDISTDARIQFVRHIQPMLVHGCSVGGCHQPGSRQALQLDRWALEGNGNATLVRRNLASVFTQLNKDDPASSPLIQWARQAHGGRTGKPSTPLAPYQAALLMQWLNAAAGVSPEALAPEPGTDESFAPASDEFAPSDVDAELAYENDADAAPPSAGFVPRDAFDPEVFNRKYVKRTTGKLLASSAEADPATQRPAQVPGEGAEAADLIEATE